MRTLISVPAALVVLAFSLPAMAQNNPAPPTGLPAGQTMLNISATERTQVPQDLLIATLRVEKTGPDAKALQNDINTLMKSAADKAKAVTTVKVSTGGYYVYEETPVPEKTSSAKSQKQWRGSQTLEIRSTVADDLLKLTGELQDMGLMMNGMTYTLSPEKADDIKDSLMEAALAKVKTRAERAAKAMNKTQTDIVEVNVDASDNSPQSYPMMRAMAMSAASDKMATPTAEPGETEITLTVSARALLKP